MEVLFDEQQQATDYRFLETNPAFVRQTGLAHAVGRTMRELVPAHEPFWFETYGHVARTGEARRFEHDASALGRCYDVYAFRVGAPADHRVAILFNDVSARKRVEEALRRSEEQFRLFVTASSDILYRIDAGWQHMLHLHGRSVLADTAAPSATWLETYIPPADRPAVEAAIQAAIAGRQFFALEHRVFRADGSVGGMFSHAVPVLDAHGEVVEWFGTATDITARKHAEGVLREREERQAFLLQLSDALRPLTDSGEIQGTAARVLGQHLGTDRAYYVNIDAAHEFVVARDWHRPGAPSYARRYPLGRRYHLVRGEHGPQPQCLAQRPGKSQAHHSGAAAGFVWRREPARRGW